jgi:hypothetical protein
MNTDSSDDCQMTSNTDTIKAAALAIVIDNTSLSGSKRKSPKKKNQQSTKKGRFFDHHACLDCIK